MPGQWFQGGRANGVFASAAGDPAWGASRSQQPTAGKALHALDHIPGQAVAARVTAYRNGMKILTRIAPHLCSMTRTSPFITKQPGDKDRRRAVIVLLAWS